MIKYKVAFEVKAETLFGLIAKFLPVEGLSVEEIVERPIERPMPKLAPRPKRKYVSHLKGSMNLEEGINAIIMDLLSDGKPHRPFELEGPVTEAGYSRHGIASRLSKLKEHGFVMQPQMGLWQKVKEGVK